MALRETFYPSLKLALAKSKPPPKPKRKPGGTKLEKKERPRRAKARRPKSPPKPKPGPKSKQSKAKLYRFAGQRGQLQKERNDLRGSQCMKQLRYGFRLMWREAPRQLRKYNVKLEGQYDPLNSHGGVCWAWPRECKLTNIQARAVFYECYKKRRLTIHQIIVVRKAMAYAFELTGGTPGGNFPSVKEVWKIVRESELAPKIHTVKPTRIPTPEELRKAFTKEWDASTSSMSLVEFCCGLVQAYDWACCGLRSMEDISRVKRSRDHDFDWHKGWECTDFVDGRAKLCGVKKGNRGWKIWRVCFCPAGRHIRPPTDFWLEIDKKGMPTVPVKWCTVCPCACLEFLWQLQTDPRCYAKWLPASGRFGSRNVRNVAVAAIDWFVAQGACPAESRYSTNAGRKSLAGWCGHLNVPYHESFQIHGDQSLPNALVQE